MLINININRYNVSLKYISIFKGELWQALFTYDYENASALF